MIRTQAPTLRILTTNSSSARELRECRFILTPRGVLVLGLPIETSVVNRVRGQR